MKLYGYARVSSTEQNLERQILALTGYGVNERDIVTDKASGKDFQRPGYILLKEKLLRSGDTLVVKELDRLGRSAELIKKEWHDLQGMGVDIVVIDTPMLNTSNKSDLEKTLISTIVFELLAYMAEKERIKIKSRQAEGIAAAKANGNHLGRPRIVMPPNFLEEYAKVVSGKKTATETIKALNLKRNTYYKFVKMINKE